MPVFLFSSAKTDDFLELLMMDFKSLPSSLEKVEAAGLRGFTKWLAWLTR